MCYFATPCNRYHQDVVVNPYNRDCRREEGQLRRLYTTTNTHTLVQVYLGLVRDAKEPVPVRKHTQQVCSKREGREKSKLLHQLSSTLPALHLSVVKRKVAEAFDCSVSQLEWKKLVLYNYMVIDFGVDTLRFVCAPNYWKKVCALTQLKYWLRVRRTAQLRCSVTSITMV